MVGVVGTNPWNFDSDQAESYSAGQLKTGQQRVAAISETVNVILAEGVNTTCSK